MKTVDVSHSSSSHRTRNPDPDQTARTHRPHSSIMVELYVQTVGVVVVAVPVASHEILDDIFGTGKGSELAAGGDRRNLPAVHPLRRSGGFLANRRVVQLGHFLKEGEAGTGYTESVVVGHFR